MQSVISTEPDNPENSGKRIPARSRRQVMDWGLVLASQSIESTISKDEKGWGLMVAESDHAKAVETLTLYRNENRTWRWRRPLPVSGLLFHWGSAIWCVLILWIHFWASNRFDQLENVAWMNNKAVANGEWWRIFTAITLHGDVAHLASNATTGLLLLGLAMAKYGAGLGLFAAYLAGAGGNLAGYLLYDQTHRGLGASGMVMGALGLLAAQKVAGWEKFSRFAQFIFRALATGSFLFILMGTSPGTDVIAHLGGFVFGALIGISLNLSEKHSRSGLLNMTLLIATPTWVIFTWWLALRH